MDNKKIMIVVGQPSAGKDTVAEGFVKRGFAHISTGDLIRKEMLKTGILVNRENMNKFSAEMRKKKGNGYPADIAADRVTGDTVISGPRNIHEIGVLRERFGDSVKLIAVEAPIELRYNRIKCRGRIGDDITLQQFVEEEDRERNSSSGSHQVDEVMQQADVVINNSSTEEELLRKVKLVEFFCSL